MSLQVPWNSHDVSRETVSGAILQRAPGHHECSLGSDMDQRMDALRRANEVRALRAQLKRDLKAGRVSIGALLLDPPPFLETAKVFDMLLALPRHSEEPSQTRCVSDVGCMRMQLNDGYGATGVS